MSSNPYDQFDPAPASAPAKSANPYDQFDAAKPAAPTAQPAVGNPLTDTALSALDYLGMGFATKNPFMAMPSQLKQDVAQAHQNLGWLDYPVGAAAYAVGPGKILGPLAKGVAGAGVGGLAAEGAAAGGLGAIGHDENPLSGAIEGGLGGAALGGLGKAAGPLAQSVGRKMGWEGDPAAIVTSLKNTRDQQFAQLRNVQYDPADLYRPWEQANADYVKIDPNNALWLHAPQAATEVAKLDHVIKTGGAPTADDLLTTLQALRPLTAKQTPEAAVAKFYTGKINGMLGGVNPATPGITAADTVGMVQSANAAHQNYANARDLLGMSQNLRDFGTSPAGQAQDIAQTYYPLGTGQPGPQYDALSRIANAGGSHGISPWGVMHIAGHATAPIGALIGGIPGAIAGSALEYGVAKPLAGAAMNAMQRAAYQRAIRNAYQPLTGVSHPVYMPSPAAQNFGAGLSDAARNLLFGQLAG
jgi:hypothetical protein